MLRNVRANLGCHVDTVGKNDKAIAEYITSNKLFENGRPYQCLEAQPVKQGSARYEEPSAFVGIEIKQACVVSIEIICNKEVAIPITQDSSFFHRFFGNQKSRIKIPSKIIRSFLAVNDRAERSEPL